MNEPRYCPIRRRWCTCDLRCDSDASLADREAQVRAAMAAADREPEHQEEDDE